MNLDFIPPSNLPTEYCAHDRWIALYSNDEGVPSDDRSDGLYTYRIWRADYILERNITVGWPSDNLPRHYTFCRAQCVICQGDVTEGRTFR